MTDQHNEEFDEVVPADRLVMDGVGVLIGDGEIFGSRQD